MEIEGLPVPTVIEGPVAVIGDVHGQTWHLTSLLGRLFTELPDMDNRWIVLIGDFVDRGSDPKGAINIILDLFRWHPKTTAIMGNHEWGLIRALGLVSMDDREKFVEKYVKAYEAETTFASYGAPFGQLEALCKAMPDLHKQFLLSLPWYVEHPEYLFVHAGLLPDQPYSEQMEALKERDLAMERPRWLCSRSLKDSPVPEDCPKTVISGHLKVPEVQMREKRMMVDTTGGLGGKLSAVLLPEKQVVTS